MFASLDRVVPIPTELIVDRDHGVVAYQP